MSTLGYRERLAFCSLIAIVGAAFVVYGVNLQGFIWWFLVTIIIGTLLQSGENLTTKELVKAGTIIALFFILTSLTLFILLGAGMSGFRQGNDKGVDINHVAMRLNLLGHSNLGYVYGGVAVATAIVIMLASLAASYTIALLVRVWEIDESQVGKLKKRVGAITTVASLITGIVAYFKAG